MLILALWALFFLSMLAVAMHSLVVSGVDLARRLRARALSHALAKAGVERAILLAVQNTNAWDGLVSDELNFKDSPLGGGLFTVSVTLPERAGLAGIHYGVVGEEAKVNLNKADIRLLSALVRLAGAESESGAGQVAASIVDWRDTDDEVLTGGAEASYYRAQPQPYSCPNSDFRSLAELLLVKGMRPELFEKLRPHATVYGAGKVNLNAANRVVLLSVAEASTGSGGQGVESLVDKILGFRASGGIFREGNAPAIIGELDRFAALAPEEKAVFSAMMRHAGIRSTCFGGVAEGRTGRPGSTDAEKTRIAFVFDREKMNKLYWYEH